MLATTEFVNKDNKNQYKEAVFKWLELDFNKKEQPSRHFWHNKETIGEAFETCCALVALSNQQEIVGYMIWSMSDVWSEIEIIEVKENYRRQGISKKMINDFIQKFTHILLLTAHALPQAESFFKHNGWQHSVYELNEVNRYFKLLKPVVSSVNQLPDGRVIAVYSRADVSDTQEHIPKRDYIDFYSIKSHLTQYPIKYFQIEIDETGKLQIPIATAFDYEGYAGVYFNRELIVEGKVRNILKGDLTPCRSFLVIDKIDPIKPELFYKKGFLIQKEIERSAAIEQKTVASSSSHSELSTILSTQGLFKESGTTDSTVTKDPSSIKDPSLNKRSKRKQKPIQKDQRKKNHTDPKPL